MAIPDPFVGWRGRRFYFKVDGYQVRFEGPRKAVEKRVRELLPPYRHIAEKGGRTEVVEMIDRELSLLKEKEDDSR